MNAKILFFISGSLFFVCFLSGLAYLLTTPVYPSEVALVHDINRWDGPLPCRPVACVQEYTYCADQDRLSDVVSNYYGDLYVSLWTRQRRCWRTRAIIEVEQLNALYNYSLIISTISGISSSKGNCSSFFYAFSQLPEKISCYVSVDGERVLFDLYQISERSGNWWHDVKRQQILNILVLSGFVFFFCLALFSLVYGCLTLLKEQKEERNDKIKSKKHKNAKIQPPKP